MLIYHKWSLAYHEVKNRRVYVNIVLCLIYMSREDPMDIQWVWISIGFGHGHNFSPMDYFMGGQKLSSWIWIWIWYCSTRSKPDQLSSLHMDHIPHMDQSPHMNIIVLTPLFRRERLRIMDMCTILQIIMFINPRRISLLTHMLTLTPLMRNEVDWHLCHRSLMQLAEWWTLCHPSRCGWWRKITNLLRRVRSADELKMSEEFVGGLNNAWKDAS